MSCRKNNCSHCSHNHHHNHCNPYPPCPPYPRPKCNSTEVELNSRYSRILPINFDSTNTSQTLTLDDVLNSEILITCDGTTDFTPNTYQLYLPDLGTPYWRKIRQYHQFQKIPINFLASTFNIRLNGNAVLEVYINNVLFNTYLNAIFYLSETQIPPIKITYPQNIFLYYAQSDDDSFSQTPYYCEPLIQPVITNCCYCTH